MWFSSLRNPNRSGQIERRDVRLALEQLEDRLVPSNYSAGTVTELIHDINVANKHGGINTITLTAPSTTPYILTAVNNTTNGANGLPMIAAKDNLTILGNGDTIERSTVSGTPAFRLLDVASGGSLTLENLTLQNGLAFGAGSAADGGAIFNQGTLDLIGVTVQNNIAQGQNGTGGWSPTAAQSAAGGAVYSSGALTLQGGTLVQNNEAVGGAGAVAYSRGGLGWPPHGLPGGNSFGGGLYVAGGTATITDTTISSNSAKGGPGGGSYPPIFYRGKPGLGEGGGLYINTAATVSLDTFTVANVLNNTASTSDPNIYGSYTEIA